LISREAQEEALEIFDKIIKETGWRIEFIKIELKETWGWNAAPSQHQQPETPVPTESDQSESTISLLNSPLLPASKRQKLPSGIVNPTMATADFSMENHPYQNYYVAPRQLGSYQHESY
jgi:hypothetical protein